jgi:UDP-N-acetylglucosamine--N-acetylmuramyl-(pentapeptide) pyrophosphoryl-undecaprenol N-acetylglucosamine transferase
VIFLLDYFGFSMCVTVSKKLVLFGGQTSVKYLFTGGGTGGHVYPALAIADEIRRQKPEAEILFVGRKDKLESRVVPNQKFEIKFVRSLPFPRSWSPVKLLFFAGILCVGILQSTIILMRFRPKMIIGTGGYVSAPILFAYGFLRKIRLFRSKVFLYEPNACPGLLNKVSARFADCVGVGFDETASWFDKGIVAKVGYPVRREFKGLDKIKARTNLGIDQSREVVLVLGGSGGSRAINQALILALPNLIKNPNIFVFHITGNRSDSETFPDETSLSKNINQSKIEGFYRQVDYVDDISQVYAAADLIVCRGGAGTLTELGVVGRPSIVIPASIAADDHQVANARQIEMIGAGKVLYEKAKWMDGNIEIYIDPKRVFEVVSDTLNDKEGLRKMSFAALSSQETDSLKLIVELLESMNEGQSIAISKSDVSPNPLRVSVEPNKILGWVENRIEQCGGLSQLPRDEINYYCYQADRMLASSAWLEIPLGVRNVGVKLVGLLKYQQHRQTLLQVLLDKKPVNRLKRSLGGDYLHNGILRRNVIERGLTMLGECDVDTQLALEQALLEDPYFEVRSAAARLLGQLSLPNTKSEDVLMLALMDVSAVVKVEVLAAVGAVAKGPTILSTVKNYYQHSNWMLRMAVVQTLETAYERGEIEAEQLKYELEQIHSISSHFEPNFLLANRLRDLKKQVLSAIDQSIGE